MGDKGFKQTNKGVAFSLPRIDSHLAELSHTGASTRVFESEPTYKHGHRLKQIMAHRYTG
jgi:hypothetical protein